MDSFLHLDPTPSPNENRMPAAFPKFRENLAGYLESGTPLAITRHGETLGFYIPAQKRNRKAEIEAMRAAAKELDRMIASWGATEDELMDEYKEIHRAAREKNSYRPGDPLAPEVALHQKRFCALIGEYFVRTQAIQEFCLHEGIADLVRR